MEACSMDLRERVIAAYARGDVRRERARFARRLKRIAPKRFVFLDAASPGNGGVRVGMKRAHGRSAPGFQIIDHASAGRWETHPVTAATMVTKKASTGSRSSASSSSSSAQRSCPVTLWSWIT